jgi:hypothetical protein
MLVDFEHSLDYLGFFRDYDELPVLVAYVFFVNSRPKRSLIGTRLD